MGILDFSDDEKIGIGFNYVTAPSTTRSESLSAVFSKTKATSLTNTEGLYENDQLSERDKIYKRLTGSDSIYGDAVLKYIKDKSDIYQQGKYNQRLKKNSPKVLEAVDKLVADLKSQDPEKYSKILDTKGVKDAAINVRKHEVEEADKTIAGAPKGFFTGAANLAGGVAASFLDPVNLLTSAFGAGISAGILKTAMVEAGINVATEAVTIFDRKENYEELGFEYGADEILNDLITAGAFGAVFAGGLKTLGKGAEFLAGNRAKALEIAKRESGIDKSVLDTLERNMHESGLKLKNANDDIDLVKAEKESLEEISNAYGEGRPINSENIKVSREQILDLDADTITDPILKEHILEFQNRLDDTDENVIYFKDRIKENLKDSGMEPDEIEVNALLYAKGMNNLSKGSGLSRKEFIDKFEPSINKKLEGTPFERDFYNQIDSKNLETPQTKAKAREEIPVVKSKEKVSISEKELNKPKKFLQKNVPRGEFINEHSGNKISINAQTLKKAESYSKTIRNKQRSSFFQRLHIEVGQDLDALVKKSEFSFESSNLKGKEANWEYYFAPYKKNGKEYLVKLEVEVNRDGGRRLHNYVVVHQEAFGSPESSNLVNTKSQISPPKEDIDLQGSSGSHSSLGKTLEPYLSSPERTSMSKADFDQNVNTVREKLKFFQGENIPKGQISFKNSGINISLFKNADKSTFMHEAAHLWLKVMSDLSKTSPKLKTEMDKILKWMGIKDISEMTVEHQEMWSRGWEQYLREGKAPSKGLEGAFDKFKNWLREIYESALDLNVELNDDVRGIYDRILATDREIAYQKMRNEGLEPISMDQKRIRNQQDLEKLNTSKAVYESEIEEYNKLTNDEISSTEFGDDENPSRLNKVEIDQELEDNKAIGEALNDCGVKL